MAGKAEKTIAKNSNSIKNTRRIEQLLEGNKKLKSELAKRRKHEDELRARSLIYSNLVEKGNDGIVIIQNGLVQFVNNSVAKLTGFKKKEAVGQPFINFVVKEYRKFAIDRHKRRLKGQEIPSRYEIELIKKNGKTLPVEISSSLIEHNGKTASMAIIRDITERKQAENTIKEEKRKMETIYKTTREGLVLYDEEGRVIFMNPALRNLFGVKGNITGVKRETIVRDRSKFFKYHMERYDNSIETQRQVYSGKMVSNVLMKIHSKPPRYLEGSYVPIKDSKRCVVGMSASFRDVTLLKTQAEKIEKQLIEVEKQKNRMQAIFENVEEGSFIFDTKLRIIQANNACEIFSGEVEKDMVGRKYYEVFGCHDKLDHYYPNFNPVSKVLAAKESIPYDEHLHKSKKGKDRWVGVSYTPILNQKGEIDQIVGIIRDITSLKELDQAKSGFVSLASHELRTPLTVINGYLSLLLNGDLGSLDNEKTRSNFMTVLNKVQSETKRIMKLVGELLNVSRIEEGRLKLNLRKIDPNLVIKEVNEELRPYGAMKGVRMLIRSSGEHSSRSSLVLADKDRLKEILVNLLENAIKFTASGDKITTTCFSRGGKMIIEVEDTGSGIAENMQPRIFEKFQQATGSYLKENKGTGLGLFIVKSLVNLHNGDISVNSKIGKGTTFTFYLPKVAD